MIFDGRCKLRMSGGVFFFVNTMCACVCKLVSLCRLTSLLTAFSLVEYLQMIDFECVGGCLRVGSCKTRTRRGEFFLSWQVCLCVPNSKALVVSPAIRYCSILVRHTSYREIIDKKSRHNTHCTRKTRKSLQIANCHDSSNRDLILPPHTEFGSK